MIVGPSSHIQVVIKHVGRKEGRKERRTERRKERKEGGGKEGKGK